MPEKERTQKTSKRRHTTIPTYSVRPIPICYGMRDLGGSTFTWRLLASKTLGIECKMVTYIWYLEGSNPKTIVDAGVNPAPPAFEEIQTPEAGLAKLGLKPDDIEIVIVTHLHLDHIEKAKLFKNAKFVIQKKEFNYALHPRSIGPFGYVKNKKLIESLNVELVDGEKEIIPGVTVFLTPGHSLGGQSIEINTKAGKAIITGFCSRFETFDPPPEAKGEGWEVSLPLHHWDVWQMYQSVLKVKRRADIIIPNHDPTFLDKERIP
jgi:N-acyl homoserine lactone hydrolase